MGGTGNGGLDFEDDSVADAGAGKGGAGEEQTAKSDPEKAVERPRSRRAKGEAGDKPKRRAPAEPKPAADPPAEAETQYREDGLPVIPGVSFVIAEDVKDVLVRVLVFGKSGAGKTHLLTGTKRKTLVILVESQGFNTIKRANPKAVVPGTVGVDGTPRIGSLTEMRAVLAAIRDGAFKRYGIELVVIDGATEVQLMIIDDILKRKRAPATTVQGEKNDSGARMKRAERLLTQADWGTVADRFRGFLRQVRDLPVDVAMTALADWRDDEETKQTQLGPMVKGSSARSINGYFNAALYLYRKQDENAEDGALGRFLLTDGDERYSVKPDGGLRGVVRPDLDAILDVLHAKADPASVFLPDAPMPHRKPGSVALGGLDVEVEGDDDEDSDDE